MEDPGDFVIGAGAIGLGVLAQGIPGVGTLVGGMLFSFGAGKLVEGSGIAGEQGGIVTETRATYTQLPVVYGTAKVGGALTELRADPETSPDEFGVGSDEQFAGKLVAFAVGSENGSGIEGVDKIWLDEELAVESPVFTDDHVDTNLEDFFSVKLEYSLHRGSDDQLGPVWLQNRFGEELYSDQFRGRGLAMFGMALEFDREVFPGVPTMQALVKGNRIYDPRSPSGGPDSDGFAWSRNPWLVLLDYLTSVRYGLDAFYPERDGGTLTESEIDEQSFIDAANHAEEQVPFTKADGTVGTHQRHTFDGWLRTATDPEGHKQNITQIVQSTGGMLVHQSGQWRAVPKRPTAPADLVLDEDTIVGGWSGRRSGIQDAPNRVRADYVDSDRRYTAQEVHWPELTDPVGFRDEDGGFPSELSLDLPGVTDRARAQRMAQQALCEARADKTFTLRATEAALQLQVGDVVRLKHPTPGYDAAGGFPDGKRFWITRMGIQPEDQQLTVGLTLREYDADCYVAELGSPPEETPDPELPDLRQPTITNELIGAWQLGFHEMEGTCDLPERCTAGPCLCGECDSRREQIDLSGFGVAGAITKSAGFKWSDICKQPGVVGPSYANADGGSHVNIEDSHLSSHLQLTNKDPDLDLGLGQHGFTGMAWFLSTSLTNTTASFGQRDDTNKEGWEAFINSDGTEAGFQYYGQDGGLSGTGFEDSPADIVEAVGRSVGQDEWVHFAVTVGTTDEDGNFEVRFYINGTFVGARTMTDGNIVATTTNATLGWGSERGDQADNTRIVGRMNMGMIWDGALAPDDIQSVQSGETTVATASEIQTIDQIGDGQDFARVRQEWTDDGRPKDWIDGVEIVLDRNDTCSEGDGLRVRVRGSGYTSLSDADGGDYRLFVDWWEDGTHVKGESDTQIWDVAGGRRYFNYEDTTTGSDAGDAQEHLIVARLILMDITGTDPVALDSKSAGIRATYGFSCP